MRASRKPLKRKKPMKRKRTARRSSRIRDREYMDRVRSFACWAAKLTAEWVYRECDGAIEAHHAGSRPMGRKADDHTCIPLCKVHHQDWHAGAGPFKGWGRTARRLWADVCIEATQKALGYTATGETK